jgi:predicted O-methyltransferase YrrM
MADFAERFPELFREVLDGVRRGTSYPEVRDTFERYGLLDDRVRFLRGWFRDTLDTPEIGTLALLRIDADLYDSTYQPLAALYPKVAPGGYVIVDDFHTYPECQAAVLAYFRETGISPERIDVDGDCVYWRKAARPVAAGVTGD